MGRGGLHLRNRIPLERAPAEAPELGQERVLVLGGITLLGLLALVGRFWYFQVAHGDSFLEEARSNQRAKVRIAPPRGIIEDRNGVALLTNTSRIDIFMTPSELGDWMEKEVRRRKKALKAEKKKSFTKAEVNALYLEVQQSAFKKLADKLEVPVAPLLKEYEKNRLGTSEPARVFAGATQAQLARVAEHLADLPGITPMVVPVRQYPKGRLAAQVLGYVDQISQPALANEQELLAKAESAGQDTENMPRHRPGDLIGTYGLERYYDRLLSGKEGSIDYLVNAQQERLSVADEQKAVPGAKLTLTFDWRLQALAEKLLQGKKGAVVAIDPRDGGVLAMASYPSFDPAIFQRRPIPQKVMDTEVTPGQNEWATNPNLAPGSTFKIISSAAGLMENRVSPGTSFVCTHEYLRLRCHGTHGSVSVRGALAQSCDVYFYHVGQRLGEEKLKTWTRHFGLGQPTGIDLPEDPIGYLSTSATKRRKNESMIAKAERHGNKALVRRIQAEGMDLSLGELMQTAIGQGLTGTSPLHIALVASAVANPEGKIFRPHFLKKVIASDGSGKQITVPEAQPAVAHQPPVSGATWNVIREGMRAVTTSGTARGAATGSPFYIAGKTGTAETAQPGRTNAWFTGYAARKAGEAPTIAICVFLFNDGKNLHGGEHAAPIARRIIDAHFGVGLTDTRPATVTTGASGD